MRGAEVAALGAVLATMTSALIGLPLVIRLAGERSLTRRISWALAAVVLLGAVGIVIEAAIF